MRPKLDLPLPRNFLLLLLLFLAFSAKLALSGRPETISLDDAIRQFAERIATIPNLHGPLRLQFLQDANFVADTGKDWQEFFRKELENHHLALAEDTATTLLRVGLAETPTQLVFSASVHAAEKDEVRFLTVPRTAFRAANLPVAPIRIERQLVYQSPDRILDASSLGSEGGMALLAYRGAELSVLRLDTTGEVKQSVSLTAAGARLSRDPLGELTVRASGAAVLLPGKSCEFAWSAPAETQCHSAKPTWRAPTVLTPPCNAGGWKLLADAWDWSTPDVLQVVPDGSSQEGTSLLRDFPGPILNIRGEQNPASALVLTRNLRTGNYEVYKINLACGN